MYEAFVYVWTNTKNNMYYIGKHKGLEDDGYISSGKHFLAAYNADPHAFSREIVFRGTHEEVRKEEIRRINEAIRESGYDRIYNLTTWGKLQSWKRTCLHCGSICCPENEQWAQAFEEIHFSNCNKANKKSLADVEWTVPRITYSNKRQERQERQENFKGLTRKQYLRKQERIRWWKEYDERTKSLR
jgi:hypothetical protein